tara:strand:+ start:160 stop:1101 length:942 start_codon:yes stop_codon:yes gene_type:complete
MINKKSKIFLAGHKGLVGSAIYKLLLKKGYNKVKVTSKKNLNLLNQHKVFKFLKNQKFDAIIIAAAKVGGIKANNNYRADFIYQNLQIQNNLIHGAFLSKVKKLIFLGSSCIYPKNCKQPMRESYLLTGKLEDTNEPYAIAKIAGIKLCENYNRQYKTNFLSLMPTNTFGIEDNFHPQNSHFLAAVIRKIHLAKEKKLKKIKLWGTGKPKREIMFVEDIANACLFFLKKKTRHSLINIGSGYEKKISEYSDIIKNLIYPKLEIKFDKNKEIDGVKRKLMSNKLAKSYGWKSKCNIENSLKETILNLNFKKIKR